MDLKHTCHLLVLRESSCSRQACHHPPIRASLIFLSDYQTAELVLWGAILRRIIAFNYIMSAPFCSIKVIETQKKTWLCSCCCFTSYTCSYFFFYQGFASKLLLLSGCAKERANCISLGLTNVIGLIHAEVLNDILISLHLQSVAVVDLATEELTERHMIRFSSKMAIHTCKFSFSAAACILTKASCLVAVIFLWILGIEAALNLTSLGTRARAGATIKFSPCARFAINGSLLAVLAVPAIIILWISIVRSTNVGAIEATSEEVVANLLQRAPTYSPEDYNPSSLLGILKPTESISLNTPHVFFLSNFLSLLTLIQLGQRRLDYATKIMLYVYLVQHLFISAVSNSYLYQTCVRSLIESEIHMPKTHLLKIYLPTWIIVSRRLAQETVPADHLTGISSADSPVSDHRNAMLRVRRRIIKHGYLIILEEVLYLPPLVYMALHGPSAITGNIIMAFSIQNAFYTLQKSKNSAKGEAKVSLSPDPEKANDDSLIESKC
ncbi:hypothetical protein VP01_792g6 [Puccinia sorghi]|uniref:Uncharacterized protein n=1 Tax=Puccinia sorghi TaxID=27349 RepID=A0A0L6UBN2_9BASI|nr:hypothetical protein VP01_792g6 [Puccinia sorghi]